MEPFRRTLLQLAALAALPFAAGAQPVLTLAAGPAALQRLAERLRRLAEDGLDPILYGIPADGLASADYGGWNTALARAAQLALGDLLQGRLRTPPANRPDIVRDLSAMPLEPWYAALAQSPEPAELIERAALLPPDAAALKAALVLARALAAKGPWAQIPAGPNETIEPGTVHAVKIPALRARLAAQDPAVVPTGQAFDQALAAAVRRFQEREGLEVDGRVGPLTAIALNRPADAAVKQLRAALDMRRAAAAPETGRRIDVNVPWQTLVMTEGDRRLLEMNVIVGKPARATPMLRVRMTHLQFNPTWSAPLRNAREDILPRFQRDPRAMMEKGFRVYTIANGRYVELDPLAIDWRRVNPQVLPYVFKQDSGDANALGRLKFIMPNPDDIYMHDTPERHYFRRPDRAFSSGCIRLEKPMDLLEVAIQGTPYMDRARAEKLLADRTSATIALRQAIAVRLHYTTVLVENARVRMRPDIYGLDAAYVAAMDAPPRIASAGVR